MAKRAKATAVPSATDDDRAWRARSDLDTLTRAHEIQADRARLSAAQREGRKQQHSLARVSKMAGRKI